MSDQIFNIYKTREYTKKDTGEVKKIYTQAGTAFPHKTGNGMDIVLEDGIAVLGRCVMFERKARDDGEGNNINAVNDFQG